MPREVAAMPRRSDEHDLASPSTSSNEADRELLGHLKNACFSDKFSDMKVRLSNGEVISCHRLVVCSQCQFFDNALKEGRFQESRTGVIDMPNDPPHAVKALLEFCYKGSYTVDTALDLSDKLLLHIDVMNVAVIYNMDILEAISAEWFNSCLSDHWEAVIPVLPDVSRVAEHLHNPALRKRSQYVYGVLIIGAHRHSDLLLETETWDDLWKHAEKFMKKVTRGMELRWWGQGGHVDRAEEWLTKALGAETLRVVKCPNPNCAVTRRGLVLSRESVRTCDRCGFVLVQ